MKIFRTWNFNSLQVSIGLSVSAAPVFSAAIVEYHKIVLSVISGVDN